MAESNDQLFKMRHSTAHLLAAAVQQLYPGVKFGIGPVIENGFYYDFEFPQPITEEDLIKIEAKMREIKEKNLPITHFELPIEEALKKVEQEKQPYKAELIRLIQQTGTTKVSASDKELTQDLPTTTQTVSFYQLGDFVDLCKGPHVDNTQQIGAFKLLNLAGAYWRGSEKNPMLTRIYGTAFFTQTELEQYLKLLEEAKKRDHKKLGPQLELFMFHPTAPGMPYWLPKGVIVYNQLIEFWREEHQKRGYQEIVSPLLNRKELYITSGHFEHYWENMFVAQTSEGEEYGVKAMNCPNAMNVFAFKLRSYRDLPLRLADTDTLHRYELSGTLNGLLRVREFRQDDAHIFVSEDQIGEEFIRIFEIAQLFYAVFGMEYAFRLGTRPEKFMGDLETWNKAEQTLKEILEKSGKKYFIEEGDGAFYGPKIDILMKDALSREWQMGTIQLDFQMPKRFNLTYIDPSGQRKTPVVIHRVIYGSLERFIGILIEHFSGAFPTWLSPIQVRVIPIAARHNTYGQQILKQLLEEKIRAELDEATETMQAKIRKAQLEKIPYMLIIGDREVNEKRIAVRTREGKDLGTKDFNDFLEKLKIEIKERRLGLMDS